MTKTNKDDDKATQSSGLINNQPDPDETSKQEDHQFSNADMAGRSLATVTREDERSADDVGHHPDQPPEEIDTWIHSHEANSRIMTRMPVLDHGDVQCYARTDVSPAQGQFPMPSASHSNRPQVTWQSFCLWS